MAHALDEILQLDGNLLFLLVLFIGELLGGSEVIAHAPLDVAHGKPVFDGIGSQFVLCVFRQGDQGAGVTCAQFAGGNEADYLGRQGEKAQRIGDGGAGFADALGKLLLREVVLVHQLFHGIRRLDGVEILALQVFDEGDLLDFAVGVRAHDHGDLPLARNLCRAVAAFARDDHVFAVFRLVDDDGHDQPVFFDGIGEFVERVLVEMFARLVGVGADVVNIHLGQPLDVLGERHRLLRGVRLRRVLVCFLRVRK